MIATTDDPRTESAEAVNALLRNERAAVETYTHAIGLFDDPAVIEQLQKIRDEHRRAERELRDCVVRQLGVPATDGGLWDAVAAVAGSNGKAVGGAAVLAALRQGEEFAVGAYEDALNHEGVHPDCNRLISAELLTASRRHIDDLNRLLGGG